MLFVVFFLLLFVAAPFTVAVVFSGSVLLSTLVVQATAAAISGVSVSLAQSFKAIVYSFFFTAVAVFTGFSFLIGGPQEIFANPGSAFAASVPLLALQYLAFVLGFKVALDLTLLHAIVVAAASTLITSGALWYIAKMARHAS